MPNPNPSPANQFKKGVSGNPNGRTRVGDSAAKFIRNWMEGDDFDKLRKIVVAVGNRAINDGCVKSAGLLFDRAYGKSVAKVEVTTPELTVAQLVQGVIVAGEAADGNGTGDGEPDAGADSAGGEGVA